MCLRRYFYIVFLICLVHSAEADDDIGIPHSWADVNPAIRSCLDAHTKPPPSVLEQQGIGPDDPRVIDHFQRCQKMTLQNDGNGTDSPKSQATSAPPSSNPTDATSPFQLTHPERNTAFMWIVSGIAGLLDLFLFRPPLMGWYKRQYWFVRGRGPVDILFKQVGYRLGFELFIFSIPFILIYVGAVYLMQLLNS